MASNQWEIEKLLAKLKEFPAEAFESWRQSDYLYTWNLTDHQVRILALTTLLLQTFHRERKNTTRLLDNAGAGNIAVSIFRDKSTRTRFSFASAASSLGLGVVDLDETKSQMSHGETTRETAVMISFVTSVIGVRDDLFLNSHEYHIEVINAIDEAYRHKILHQRCTLVNLQCDLDHPTQSMSDLCHLLTELGDDGSLTALKGKKVAVTWAHSPAYGKPRSVPQALITLLTRFGAHVALAHPEGYDLEASTLQNAAKFAAESGGSFVQVSSMQEAYKDADAVYSKSWAPLSILEARTTHLTQGTATADQMSRLEKECKDMNAKYQDWECTEDLMQFTKKGLDTMYMHCLPADITGINAKAGEVSKEVFERHRLATYREASYKPFVISAAVVLSQSNDALKALETVAQ